MPTTQLATSVAAHETCEFACEPDTNLKAKPSWMLYQAGPSQPQLQPLSGLLYLRDMLTLKGLDAGGYIDCLLPAQAGLAHTALTPGKHSPLLAYDQGMLPPARYLMQQYT